jgi:hypothetical protein
MAESIFESRYTIGVMIGVIFGMISRLIMLRTDYRQYPTHPHGKIIHISLGVIAAGLGAVAVPALFNKDYTAMTFLALAAQQFRDVRNMERETLTKMDTVELVPKGATYIEGIALVFEGRNYLVILTSFTAALFTILYAWYWGALAGILSILLSNWMKQGKTISHIATITPKEISLEGADLRVDDIYIMNVGLDETRDIINKHGMGFILEPKNKNCRITLANLGQRQALLHDLATRIGVFHDSGEPGLVPMTKLDMNDGRLAVFFIAQEMNVSKAEQVLNHAPLLESAIRMPSRHKVEQKEGQAHG